MKVIAGKMRSNAGSGGFANGPVWFFLALLLFQGLASASPVLRHQSGVVTRVVDGDTVWVQTTPERQTLKVRLSGIDAPEICQAGGVQARAALQQRVLGQQVTLAFQRHDDYGRVLATVALDGEDLGLWMVRNGHAWSYRYRRSAGPYAAEQAQAMQARRGLFESGSAENPRLFRKRHGSCYP